MKYCTKCGKELPDDARFCGDCGAPVQRNVTAPPADTRPQHEKIDGVKVCAKCKAHNAMASKKCSECGHIFGLIASEKEGKKKIGKVTCPDCGTVYRTHKSTLFGVCAIVLGLVIALSWWGIAGIVMIVMGIRHLSGKMLFGSVKKCPACHRTPLGVGVRRLTSWIRTQLGRMSDWRNKKLLARKDSALVRFAASMNTKQEKVLNGNLLPVLTFVPLVLYIILMFASHPLAGSLWGLETTSEKALYIDAVMEFGSDGLILLFWLAPLFYMATSVATFSKRGRLNGLSLLTGLLASGCTILVAALNHQVEYATRRVRGGLFDEYITYEYYYDLGATNALLMIGAIVLLAVVCLAFLVELERRYLKLTAEGGTNQ